MQKHLVPALFIAALICNIITCLVAWSYAGGTGGNIPVHYSVASGVDQVGSPALLYQLPFFAFLVLGLNAVLLRLLGNLGRYIKLLCASSALVVSLVVLLSMILLKLQSA